MHPYVIVDVFTDTPLEGNPLAVFTAGEGIAPERMQRVAREMNLSETVFVLPPEEGGDARIRIFTPAVELPFAGHPTLGSAFVLCGQRGLGAIELETGAGVVRVEFAAVNGPGLPGRMRQPIPTWEPYEWAAGQSWKLRNFVPALGVTEDPATGSAAGPLAVHLARHDQIAFGQQIEIRQGAEIGRPSILLARVEATAGEITSVEVAGSAVMVARGELLA
jgi:trans-2,3-dihydro-3-hydroxyanthranilate isomerase